MNIHAHMVVSAALLALIAGCSKTEPSAGHRSFDTPEAAAAALLEALEKDDARALSYMLGPGSEKIASSGDPATDRTEREAFARKYRDAHRFVAGTPNRLVLQVGEENFPLPTPLVRQRDGWRFDGAAGVQEIAARRIGRNELHAIDVMRVFIATRNAPERSPGYLYRSLSAPDLALIATPEAYGSTGIMTFIVSQGGRVWQKDLGERSAQLASSIQNFHADETWTPIAPE